MDAAKSVQAELDIETLLRVAVVKKGGTGRLTSAPDGIDCSAGACESLFDAGSRVVLTGRPDPRSRLVGWSVPSCGTHRTCSVSLASDLSVAAIFGPGSYRVTAVVRGSGRVKSTPAGITCRRTCTTTFPYGRSVRLSAEPAEGWRFAGWSGDCHSMSRCTVQATEPRTVRATFRRS